MGFKHILINSLPYQRTKIKCLITVEHGKIYSGHSKFSQGIRIIYMERVIESENSLIRLEL